MNYNPKEFGMRITKLRKELGKTQQETADRCFKLGLIPKAVNVKEIVWKWTPGS